jgi:hypothetical protein
MGLPQRPQHELALGANHFQRVIAMLGKQSNRVEKLERGQVNAASIVTTLPTNPYNGMVVQVQTSAMSSANVVWRFRYNENAGTYKWEFVGGGAWIVEIAAQQTAATGGAYQDLATSGPSITVPFAGVYEVAHGSAMDFSVITSNRVIEQTVKVGSAAAGSANSVYSASPNLTGLRQSISRVLDITAAAGDELRVQYRVPADTGRWQDRWLRVIPIVVG